MNRMCPKCLTIRFHASDIDESGRCSRCRFDDWALEMQRVYERSEMEKIPERDFIESVKVSDDVSIDVPKFNLKIKILQGGNEVVIEKTQFTGDPKTGLNNPIPEINTFKVFFNGRS